MSWELRGLSSSYQKKLKIKKLPTTKHQKAQVGGGAYMVHVAMLMTGLVGKLVLLSHLSKPEWI